jgi:6-phosphofructokinase 1
MRVIGVEDGFEGLLGASATRSLNASDVRGLLPRGGTILGTRNRGLLSSSAKRTACA